MTTDAKAAASQPDPTSNGHPGGPATAGPNPRPSGIGPDPSLLADPAFFVPRRWLESQVDDWLTNPAAKNARVLVISGPPGTGKSRFLYGITVRLAAAADGPRLGALILRDVRATRIDEFSWPSFRDQLLALVDAPALSTVARSVSADVRVGSVTGGKAVGIEVTNLLLGTTDPVRELREVVLPALASLPAGAPVVVVVDGLDEAYRDNARDFLDVIKVLAAAVSRCPASDQGLGRLRLLLASQPEVPVNLTPLLQPTLIDLASPGKADRQDLELYVGNLLHELDETHRTRLSRLIAEQADGVWVLAFYAARSIADDVAAGDGPPETVAMPASLTEVYGDALDRMRERVDGRWQQALALIGLVAAAQDVGAALPDDVAAAVLGLDGNALNRLLADTRAVLLRGHDARLRFFHGDFGRWVSDGGLGPEGVLDAHNRLAQTLSDLGRRNWAMAGRYALAYVAPHALAAAELGIGKISHGSQVDRCLELMSDRRRLAADPSPRHWLDHLQQLSEICSAGVCLPGTQEPLAGLVSRLRPILQLAVGSSVIKELSTAQVDEFETLHDQGDTRAAKLWLNENAPRHESVVDREVRRLLGDVLDGWRPEPDPGLPRGELAADYRAAWKRTREPRLLSRAVAAYEESLGLTPVDHPSRTARLIGLVNSLVDRIDADAEQDGDLDRLLQLQLELVDRDDLEDPAASRAVLAHWLHRRWRRAPTEHPTDLTAAVAAFEASLGSTPVDHPRRTGRLSGLVNTLIGRIDTDAEQDGDLDRLIQAQTELVSRDDLSEPATSLALLAHWLYRRWRRDANAHADDLSAAVRAYETSLSLTPRDDPKRTGQLTGLVNALIGRIDTDTEQDGDLDRLLQVQAELIALDTVPDRAVAWSVSGQWSYRRWQRDATEHPDDLTAAITAFENSLRLTPADDPKRTVRLTGLANALGGRIDTDTEQDGDLDRLVEVQAELVTRDDLKDPPTSRAILGQWLHHRYQRKPAEHPDDLPDAIAAFEDSLRLTPADHPKRTVRLTGLANALASRIDTDAEQDGDLDRLIQVQTELTTRDDVPHPGTAWAISGQWLFRRWQRGPVDQSAALDAAVAAYGRALDLISPDHPNRAPCLVGLTNALAGRIDTDAEQDDDLDRLLQAQGELVTRDDLQDPAASTAVFAHWLFRRWRRQPGEHPEDLTAAITAYEAALRPLPDDHPKRSGRLTGLVNALASRADTDAEQDGDLDRLIQAQTELTARDDVEDPATSWAILAHWLHRRWQRDSAEHPDDVDLAVSAFENSLRLTPAEHPKRTGRLTALANALAGRIDTDAEQDGDLDRLLQVQTELVDRDDVEDRAASWAVLGHWLHRRSEPRSGRTRVYLHEAIHALETSLAATPADHPNRTGRLAGLANALAARVDTDAEQDGDLDRLLEVQTELVARDDLQDRAASTTLLAHWLHRRWRRRPTGHPEDLAEAITAFETALSLTPADHPNRVNRLVGAANAHVHGELSQVAGAELDKALRYAAEIRRLRESDLDGLVPALRRLVRLGPDNAGAGADSTFRIPHQSR
ncbi:DUF5663 domain-containing protein [Micromonospora sp. C28SCA-DRY-2]|uniref:DUF5663 domain-containing protein n=1 Tax=Micromonospora sp. C28SCA-DRY-2 TaxID=3059522 RepID=UPI002674BCDD|nr:DUF5663 domain-containing protein [Micromonospora sp. C28SCA-DRY-2]MDO3705142.1 DUF5663 domain-containing protein [Micromonospora sp. C28SCA-DRY-2]